MGRVCKVKSFDVHEMWEIAFRCESVRRVYDNDDNDAAAANDDDDDNDW